MGTEKPDKIGKIECLLCSDYYWYINSSHLRTAHNMEFGDYSDRIAKKHGYDKNEPPFDDDTIHSANKWDGFSGDLDLEINIKFE